MANPPPVNIPVVPTPTRIRAEVPGIPGRRGLKGDKGDKGDKGERGAQGPKGDTGPDALNAEDPGDFTIIFRNALSK